MKMRVILFLSVGLLVLACSRSEVKGTAKFLVPWPTETGAYRLQVVEAQTMKDTSAVSGAAARIYMEPKVLDTGINGLPPSAKFAEDSSGVRIPLDFMSAQLAGVYLHAEKLWNLDKLVGVDSYLARPRRYGMQARVQIENGNELKNNATFIPDIDGTLIVPYDGQAWASDKQLPISLNAGILAHEHFHALFNSYMGSVIQFQGEEVGGFLKCEAFAEGEFHKMNHALKMDPVYRHNLLVMRGINEGLADIWGWIYTGDDEFILHSIPEVNKRRNFVAKHGGPVIATKDFFERSAAIPDQYKFALSYDLGTQVARVFRQSTEQLLGLKPGTKLSYEQRAEIGKSLVNSFPRLKQAFEAKSANLALLDTTIFLDTFFTMDLRKKLDPAKCHELQVALSESAANTFKQKNCAQ